MLPVILIAGGTLSTDGDISFQEYVSNMFMDTQFGESFIPTIVTARYVINDTRKLYPYNPLKIIHKINLSFKKNLTF